MTQRTLESTLGRMITDAAFRDRFYNDAASACREHNLDLTPGELSALLQLDNGAVESLSRQLDPRIIRALTVSLCSGSAIEVSRPSAEVADGRHTRARRSA
jgi:hypothetical protein